MSNFKDVSWVPQQHKQLQTFLSTLEYCVTWDDELNNWKVGCSNMEEDEWKKLLEVLDALGHDSSETGTRFRSPWM